MTDDELVRLVDAAVEISRRATNPDEYDGVWETLRSAADAGGRAVDLGLLMLGSEDPDVRGTGCDLLSQCFDGCQPDRTDVGPALVALAEREEETDVLWSLARALGYVKDPVGTDVLVRLVGHDDGDVRFQAALALPCMVEDGPDDRVVDALIWLSGDPEPEVRNWATFGLGRQLRDDSTRIRDALLARADDDEHEVREEAACGLARRHDRRALPLVKALLDEDSVSDWVFEAAAMLADPALLPYLEPWGDDETIEIARRECDPARRERLDATAAALLAALGDLTAGVVWVMTCDRFGDPGPGLSIQGDESSRWSVEQVLEAVGWDLEAAVERIAGQMGQRP